MSNKPIITTDVDGVLVKWQSGLPYFAQKYNLPVHHILEMIIDDQFVAPKDLFGVDEEFAQQLMVKYNCSDFIRYLAAYDDALKVVNALKDKYDFVAVTALGTSVDAKLNRQFNLNALFPGAFLETFICDHAEPKTKLFEKIKEKYGDRVVAYIDDLPHHVDSAYEVFGGEVNCMFMPRGQRDTFSKYGEKVHNWEHVQRLMNQREFQESLGDKLEKLQKGKLEQLPYPWPQIEDMFPKKWVNPGPSEFKPWYEHPGNLPVHQPNFGIGTGIEYLNHQPTAKTTIGKA
jgi:FMN phosphatase YigB (HAD superfamily)